MCHFTRTIRSINHRWTAIISITICGFLINDEAHLLAHDTAPIQVLVTAAVVGALLLMVPYPRFGAWGTILASAIAYLLMPIPVLFAGVFSLPMYLAVGVLSYRNLAQGILATVCTVTIDLCTAYASGRLHLLSLSNITLMVAVHAFACVIGYSLHWREQGMQTMFRLREAHTREAAAHRLHDSIANRLSYAMMHIDAYLDPNHDTNNPDEEIMVLREILAQTITDTHKLIEEMDSGQTTDGGSLHAPSTAVAPSPDRPDHSPSHHNRQWLRRMRMVIDEEQSRLVKLHIKGIAVLPESTNRIMSDVNERLLTDFIRELFANVAKYANPESGYTFILSADDDAVRLSLSDCAKQPIQRHSSTGHGIRYYDAALRRAGGTCTVRDEDSSIWSITAYLPYTDEIKRPDPSPM